VPNDHMKAPGPNDPPTPDPVMLPPRRRPIMTGDLESGSLRGRSSGDKPQPVKLEAHKARTVVVGTVTHMRDGAHRAVTVQLKSYRLHAESVQPYVREVEAGPEWTALDVGWVDPVGMVVIQNNQGTERPAAFAPGVRSGPAAPPGTLEVGLSTDEPEAQRTMHSPPRTGPKGFDLVRPGEARVYSPPDAKALRVRSTTGERVPVTVYVYAV
jgi:hypothetical protein